MSDGVALWRQVRSAGSVERHYETSKARSRALTRLARRHPEEFAALFAAEKASRDIKPAASRTGECERCGLRIDAGTLCEFCEEWDE